MYIDDSPDFKTVWQLAHNWINADPDETDTNAISPELKTAIHRLMLAIRNNKISLRTRRRVVFVDESFISLIADSVHFIKFIFCLRGNVFNKTYLDSLYVKREEVIDLCTKIYCDPPPCWAPKQLLSAKQASTETVDRDDESKGWYNQLTELRKKKIGCLELARKLWEENPNQSYDQIRNHPIMKQYGNPSVFSKDSFQDWAKDYASEFAKRGGRRKKSEG